MTVDYLCHISSLPLDTESPFSSIFFFSFSFYHEGNTLIILLFVLYCPSGYTIGYCYHSQISFSGILINMCLQIVFLFLFSTVCLSTSLWTPDTFLDLLFPGPIRWPDKAQTPVECSTVTFNSQLLCADNLHYLCNFPDLFHFSSSYCLLFSVLPVKNPAQQPQKTDTLPPNISLLLLSAWSCP